MTESFREFERKGWEKAALAYTRTFADVTAGTVDALLAVTGVAEGTRVLDVAAGPGTVARRARERGARARAVDFSAEMARRARDAVPVAIADADRLPFGASSFDVALCNFGILHFAHPDQAVREMARVLVPGGRAAFTVWAPPEENAFFGAIYRALEKHAPVKAAVPQGTPFFHFASEANAKGLLAGAGFARPALTRVEWRARVASGRAMVDLFLEGSVRTAATLRAQSPESLARIVEHVDRELASHRDGVPIAAVLASAVKP